ncbi:MAG: restriction endonuclease subunit R [FCB group bacterium]|nr:restriction endonuclease subunit R [FCB group bacterium]
MEAFLEFCSNLQSTDYFNWDENQTKRAIIEKVLFLLGWDIFNPNEVSTEHRITHGRVDYALRVENSNRVFIEAKRINESLELHEGQLLNYAFDIGVELALLTNGLEWWFYLPLKPGPWQKRKVLSINLINDEPYLSGDNLINILSRSNVIARNAIVYAEALHEEIIKKETILSKLPEIWNKILSVPNELLVEIINDEFFEDAGYRIEDSIIAEFLKNEISKRAVHGNVSTPITRKHPSRPISKTKPIDSGSKKGKRYPPLSISDTYGPIIEVIKQENGEIEAKKAYNILYENFVHIFNHSDSNWNEYDGTNSRWKHHLDTAKAQLVRQGCIESSQTARKGLWRLTQKGFDYGIHNQ